MAMSTGRVPHCSCLDDEQRRPHHGPRLLLIHFILFFLGCSAGEKRAHCPSLYLKQPQTRPLYRRPRPQAGA